MTNLLNSELPVSQIEDIIIPALEEGRNHLLEHEAYRILELAGFKTPDNIFVSQKREIGQSDLDSISGDRVVCKIISTRLAHRSDIGGVRIVEKSKPQLRNICGEFERIAGEQGIKQDGMLISELIEGESCPPHQLLLSLRQDPSMGPVTVIGLGGLGTEIYSEAFTDRRGLYISAASTSLSPGGIADGLKETFFFPVLTGKTRISPDEMIKGEKLEQAMVKFSRLAKTFSSTSEDSAVTIEELEVNPLQITYSGELIPLDALMKVSGNKHTFDFPPQQGIGNLLEPRSVLIIGASAKKMNVGRIILSNLLKTGVIDSERIYLLHPDSAEIGGCRAYPSLNDLPEDVDVTVFAIPAGERAAGILNELISGGKTRSIILISGGFGETSGGKELDRRLRNLIKKSRRANPPGTVLNGPNCMGIVSRPGGYNTFFLPEYKLPVEGEFGESTAIISQSGAYIVTLISNLGHQLNPRYMITYGNQMDITVTDYLIRLKDDPNLDIFCLYIEGFKKFDGERFRRVAEDIILSGKKIIMFKAGRTRAGAEAVASHTASMAGNYRIMKRILTDTGVIMPDSLEQYLDLVKIFSLLNRRKVTGNRVGIYSNAGFECSVAADNLIDLQLAGFSPETRERLNSSLPTDIIDVNNPVDATPQTDAVNYGRCLDAISEDRGVDCVVAANVAPTPYMENLPPGEGHNEDIGNPDSYPNVSVRSFQNTSKPMVFSLDSGKLYDPAVEMMEKAGLPCFRKIERAIRALDIFTASSMSE